MIPSSKADSSNTYFLDTYALIEIVRGNKAYKNYLESTFLTTKYNLAELHYFLLTRYNLKTADFYIRKFWVYVVEITLEVISKAMVFRHEMRQKQKISYIDCLGYMVALVHGVRFLTGDRHFLGLEQVEFVR